MKIIKVAPFLNGVLLQVDYITKNTECFIKKVGSGSYVKTPYITISDRTIHIKNLLNDMDYSVFLQDAPLRSNNRLFRCGDYVGSVINYIHPDDMTYHPSGMCPASPSIIKLPSGRLLVSHDIFFYLMEQNITLVHYSDDYGKTWSYLSTVTPCFWGTLFLFGENVYLMGMDGEYGDLLLYKSNDEGATFSKPIVILKGGNRTIGGPHKAPMPIINYNGYLWTAIEYGSWDIGGHASGVISIDIKKDLMIAKNWIVSPFIPYSKQWEGTVLFDGAGFLEGNVVIRQDGELCNILRYSTGSNYKNYGKAILLSINKDKPNEKLSFSKVINFNGNNSKFTIRFDNKSKKYYTIVNRADEENTGKRNKVILMSSSDAIIWEDEAILLDYSNYEEDYTKLGFQYIDFIFHGDKILYVSRTAINGAITFHDSNCITFHEHTYI
ncbi:MAG: exo-alpha-sialidase [Clostridiales bacterium]|nr:exo-alpha-sialidase [Clostridiales bacterium]